MFRQRAAGRGDHRQRRAQVVRDRRQQRIAQDLASARRCARPARLRRAARAPRPARSARQRSPADGAVRAAGCAADCDGSTTSTPKRPLAHPPAADRRAGARRQRVGAEAGAHGRGRTPIGPREIVCRDRSAPDRRDGARRLAMPSSPGNSSATRLANVSATCRTAMRCHRVALARRGQLAAHRVQHGRAPLARAGHAVLLAHTGHQRRDGQRHDQHHART